MRREFVALAKSEEESLRQRLPCNGSFLHAGGAICLLSACSGLAWFVRELMTPAARTKKGAMIAPFRYVVRFPQTEKDDPQPQVVVAFGLRITNRAPSRSSL